MTPHDVKGLDDIAKLPIFGKAELMKSLADHPPYGDYHGFDRWDVEQRPVTVIHTTSGTTGRPQVVLFSPKSREVQALLVARIWRMQGLRSTDVIHSVYGHGMINGGHFVREAALHYTNSLFLSAGTGKETRSVTQIELMRDLKVTGDRRLCRLHPTTLRNRARDGTRTRPRLTDPRDIRSRGTRVA